VYEVLLTQEEIEEFGLGPYAVVKYEDDGSEIPLGVLDGLADRFNAPLELIDLYWTGSRDDRPGRCHTPEGRWVLGVGVWNFPTPRVTSDTFRQRGEWHFWVTYG
jgi:hypothetical protein